MMQWPKGCNLQSVACFVPPLHEESKKSKIRHESKIHHL